MEVIDIVWLAGVGCQLGLVGWWFQGSMKKVHDLIDGSCN
jgi:hypothetical protein